MRRAVDSKLLEASQELGGEFAYDRDMNDGTSLGLGEYTADYHPYDVLKCPTLRLGAIHYFEWYQIECSVILPGP